jgi:hypothetical protein
MNVANKLFENTSEFRYLGMTVTNRRWLPSGLLHSVAAFWIVVPCDLIEVYERFRGAGSKRL